MQPKKDSVKSLDEFRRQTSHLVGEVNFIRREDDLLKVCASILQSTKVLMQSIDSLKKGHPAETQQPPVATCLNKLHELLAKIMLHLTNVFRLLRREVLSETRAVKPILCVPATCITCECIARVLLSLVANIYMFTDKKFDEEALTFLVTQIGKLQVAEIAIQGAVKADSEDLFYLSPLHEKWQLIDKHSKVVKYESPAFNKKYEEFEQELLIGTAACYQGLEYGSSPLLSSVSTFFNMMYYQVFKKKGKMRGELVLAQPNPSTAALFWNFLESKYMKPILAFSMTSAKVNSKIYVPKLLPYLTLENIDEPLDLRTPPVIGVDPKFVSPKPKPVPENLVPIRVICKEKLPYQKKPSSPQSKLKFDRVLIHFHGGGFIAMSTRSHQIYLRKWARHTNTVVFTVEYRLAPEHKYPSGFDDVWQAYYWLITQGEAQLGVKMKNVILAGDSAGGNLALAVTLRAIRTHFRVPDGVLLGYPALNLDPRCFTPSLLASMDDVLLRYTFLTICLSSYVPAERDPSKDAYLSPVFTPDDELAQFPPIRIAAAGRDPLRDECYNLLYRLAKLKKDCQMIEYRMFMHGFWSMDFAFGLKECSFATQQAIRWINEMIHIAEINVN